MTPQEGAKAGSHAPCIDNPIKGLGAEKILVVAESTGNFHDILMPPLAG